MSLGWSVSFHLALASADLLRVGRRGDSSSCKVYTRLLAWLAYSHIGLVYFYTVYSKTLDICLLCPLSRVWSGQLLEGSTTFLRVLFFLNVSDIFVGGSEVVRKSFQSSLRDLNWLFSSAWSTDNLGGLRSCRRVSILLRSCLAGFFGLLLLQKVPCFLGGPKLSEGLLHACDRCPGYSSTRLLVSSFSDEEGLMGYLPCSLTVLPWWPSFLFIL